MGGIGGIGAEAKLFRGLHAEGFLPAGPARRPQAFALGSTYAATAELDSETTVFIDQPPFASATEAMHDQALIPGPARETIERQLTNPVRYDATMRNFVERLTGESARPGSTEASPG